MPRSGEDARRRLQQAALELYLERGYDRTTTAEIAARAGVTERTFFRHFPDKREVLFDGETALREVMTDAVAEAPDGLEPLDILLRVFRTAGGRLAENRAFTEPRFAVITATPALRERDLAKHASLIDAVAGALRQRGVDERRAELATRAGWAAFDRATRDWIDDPGQSVSVHLDRAFDDLRGLIA